jgi:AcrR family transcriptional regulator
MIPDQDLLVVAERELTKLGPEKLTLARIGRQSGIAAPTLIQRFGSKRRLLLEIAKARGLRVRHLFENSSGVLEAYLKLASEFASPSEAANQLAFLQMELADEEFRAATQELFSAMEAGTLHLLWRAAKAGDIEDAKGKELARACLTAYWGALVYWSVQGESDLALLLREQIGAVLAPYRTNAEALTSVSSA